MINKIYFMLWIWLQIFDEESIETIESLGYKYLFKAIVYAILVSQSTNLSEKFVKGVEGKRNYRTIYKAKKVKKKQTVW